MLILAAGSRVGAELGSVLGRGGRLLAVLVLVPGAGLLILIGLVTALRSLRRILSAVLRIVLARLILLLVIALVALIRSTRLFEVAS